MSRIIRRTPGYQKAHSLVRRVAGIIRRMRRLSESSILRYLPIARRSTSVLLARYITKGSIIKGTLLERVLKSGEKPLEIVFSNEPFNRSECDSNIEDDGLTDSLRYLLYHQDYNKPWSHEHVLATLLTKAF